MSWDSDALKKSMLIGAGSGLVIGIGAIIPFVNVLCCCIGWALWAVVGGSYGYMSQRGGKPVNVGTWALGGAAVAAVGSVVRDVIFLIGSALWAVLGVTFSSAETLRSLGIDVPSDYVPPSTDIMGTLLSACGNGVITLFIAAAMGAVGGLVWGLIRQGSSSTPTAPAQPAA